MFGNYLRTLDDKNRVIIPAKLRNQLGSVCYITIGPDNNLEVRAEESFAVYRDRLLGTNTLNSDARSFARLILGNTSQVEIDDMGRVNLPTNFLARAKITKEIVFVGVGNKIELWSKAAFDEFQNQFAADGSLDDLAKKLLKNGVEL